MAAEIGEAIKAEKAAGRCGPKTPLKDSYSRVQQADNGQASPYRVKPTPAHIQPATWLTKRIVLVPQTNISQKKS